MTTFHGARLRAHETQRAHSRARNTDNNALPLVVTDAVLELFDRLVHADLTASGYRVALSTVTRLIRQGRTSEAVPTAWIADQLGLHRNAVGNGYSALVTAGLVRRIPVLVRGAPTRTTLTGPALTLARVLSGQPTLGTGGICAESAALKSGSNGPENDRFKKTGPSGPMINLSDFEHGESDSSYETEDLPDQSPFASESDPGRVTPAASDSPASDDAQASPKAPDTRRTFGPEIHGAVAAKVPPEVLYEAMQTGVSRSDINAAWQLSDEEAECLVNYSPKREPRKTPQPSTSTIRAVPTSAPPRLAKLLWESLPMLAAKLGDMRAAEVMDEIAYMVTLKNLGQGNQLGGGRAGLHLVQTGRWKSPRGFTADWRGAVVRALQEGMRH